MFITISVCAGNFTIFITLIYRQCPAIPATSFFQVTEKASSFPAPILSQPN